MGWLAQRSRYLLRVAFADLRCVAETVGLETSGATPVAQLRPQAARVVVVRENAVHGQNSVMLTPNRPAGTENPASDRRVLSLA